MKLLSKRDRHSIVYIDNDGYVIKEQPKYLTDNEMWCLEKMREHGCVPAAKRIGIETIQMEYIQDEPVTDVNHFMAMADMALEAIKTASIRHGDLTRPHILVRGNKPYIIDWGESRHWGDPRPDKRPEGDTFWFNKAVGEIVNG